MGWAFDYGAVIGAEETQEACTQVELDDIDPDDPDAEYLYLHQMPASCVSGLYRAGPSPFGPVPTPAGSCSSSRARPPRSSPAGISI